MMVRTKETGLDYFPVLVDIFDNDKIKLIECEFGHKGVCIYIRLLCLIYSKKGYYYKWNLDKQMLLAKASNLEGSLVGEIVTGLIRRSLFDKGVFDTFGVLTSERIQLNYIEITKRRLEVEIITDYLLIDDIMSINDRVKLLNVDMMNTECKHDVNISPQSKVKNSKVKKESKKKEKMSVDILPPFNIFTELLKIFQEEYKDSRGIDYVILNKGKEQKALSNILQSYKKKNPESDTEKTLIDFRSFFKGCLKIQDDWHYERMSPSHINSQYNEIRAKVYTTSPKKTNGRAQPEYDSKPSKELVEFYKKYKIGSQVKYQNEIFTVREGFLEHKVNKSMVPIQSIMNEELEEVV